MPIVTNSPSMLEVLSEATRVGASDAPVLLIGETGVGKELFADHIHRASRYASGPLIKLGLSGRSSFGTQVQKSEGRGDGWGYRVRTLGDAVDAQLILQSSTGRYEIAQSASPADHGTSFNTAGALVAMGGSLHASRAIGESFAVVQVPHVPHVRVLLSNQPVGKTNRRGSLVRQHAAVDRRTRQLPEL